MIEEWKDIRGYEGYQVSNLGRVRTHNKTSYTVRHGERFWKDRILRPKGQTYKTGYRVTLWKNGKAKDFLVARLVAFTFFGKDINNHELTVNHKDGNRFNNNINNLELITLKENIQHAFRTGLQHQRKIRIEDKVTGTIIYPSSLAEAGKIIGKNSGYFSVCLKKGRWENEKYTWKLI